MTQPIIQVEGLGKRYTLGARANTAGEGAARYRTLRETLSDGARRLLRRSPNGANGAATNAAPTDPTEFWALKDVNFEVQPGEVVGIIGRNGAGKSTLLKILSRITEPTEGRIKIKGRVASLLEVGTGFHPELTGRENIFLNGAILGMGRQEIKAKFDEIVAFAEVEKFLDTPVKRYSSGMYVRLAFAVAAHLEPEILIVDEVLAVGDAEFQKKCLGKMKSVAREEGRTVLLVSHDFSSIQRLCGTCLLLNQGRRQLFGPTSEVISTYTQLSREAADFSQRSGEGIIRVTALEILDGKGRPSDHLDLFEAVCLRFHCIAERDISRVTFAVGFNTVQNTRALSLHSSYGGHHFPIRAGRFVAECRVPKLRLMPGEYRVLTHVDAAGVLLDSIADVQTITVGPGAKGVFVTVPDHRQGFTVDDFIWEVQSVEHLAPKMALAGGA